MSAKTKKIIEELNYRLEVTLEWYHGCDLCEETLENARREVNGLFQEILNKYNLKDFPLTLRTRFDDQGYIIVDSIDRKLN